MIIAISAMDRSWSVTHSVSESARLAAETGEEWCGGVVSSYIHQILPRTIWQIIFLTSG